MRPAREGADVRLALLPVSAIAAKTVLPAQQSPLFVEQIPALSAKLRERVFDLSRNGPIRRLLLISKRRTAGGG
jgi:hypothetical protein